jgi:hypothetical protein
MELSSLWETDSRPGTDKINRSLPRSQKTTTLPLFTQINRSSTFPHLPLKINFNVILPSMSRSCKSLRKFSSFRQKFCLHLSTLPPNFQGPSTATSMLLVQLNNNNDNNNNNTSDSVQLSCFVSEPPFPWLDQSMFSEWHHSRVKAASVDKRHWYKSTSLICEQQNVLTWVFPDYFRVVT